MSKIKSLLILAVVALGCLPFAAGSASAGMLWTPDEISTSLWLDAADAGTVTQSGGLVSQWDDKSGNSHHATATSMPIYSSSSMVFSNDSYLAIANHSDLDIAGGARSGVIFWVLSANHKS